MTTAENRFFRPRRRVTLVDFGSTLEVLCLRSLLEAMGVSVLVHFVGAPQDLFAVLDQKETSPEFLVLCGHGTETGFFLGEYGEGIDTSRLVGGCLPAAALKGEIFLPNTIILSTACLSGREAYAQAFLGEAHCYMPHLVRIRTLRICCCSCTSSFTQYWRGEMTLYQPRKGHHRVVRNLIYSRSFTSQWIMSQQSKELWNASALNLLHNRVRPGMLSATGLCYRFSTREHRSPA
jgi:hypothetical protein